MSGTIPVLLIVLAVVIAILTLALVLAFFSHHYQRVRIPNRYEWLELLDRQDWKTTLQLQKEMRQRVGTEGSAVLHQDLDTLEDEDLVESQPYEGDDEDSLDEYRLTTAGWKELLELHRSEPSRTLPRTV